MPNNKVKSLVVCCQDSLTKSLDVLAEVGCVPYTLLKVSLRHATPQQLYRIERANPDLMKESDELWLNHCLSFKDLRDQYEEGLYRDPKDWRELYLNRYKENERKRQAIKERVASQYSKIKDEKAARSIKVLHGIVPTTGRRSYEAARRSTMSKLFQQTRREAIKAASIYKHPRRSIAVARQNPAHGNSSIIEFSASNVIRAPKPPSKLIQAYQYNCAKYPGQNLPPRSSPMIAPISRVVPLTNTNEKMEKAQQSESPLVSKQNRSSPKRQRADNDNGNKQRETKRQRPAALVNFNIFSELS